MDWKTKTIIVAIAAGALAGFLAARLYIRQVEDTGGEPPKLSPGSMLTLGLSALGLIRQVAALGEPEK